MMRSRRKIPRQSVIRMLEQLHSDDQEQALFCNYLVETGQIFCPFLELAMSRALVKTVFFKIEDDRETLPEAMTAVIDREVQRFITRRSTLSAIDRRLLCVNVGFRCQTDTLVDDWDALLSFCHWKFKQAYTVKEVMFGKFWPGEGYISKDGGSVVDPPFPFISIRTLIASRDEQFFSKSSFLLDQLGSALRSS